VILVSVYAVVRANENSPSLGAPTYDTKNTFYSDQTMTLPLLLTNHSPEQAKSERSAPVPENSSLMTRSPSTDQQTPNVDPSSQAGQDLQNFEALVGKQSENVALGGDLQRYS
jgi:hypothetical protein